MEIPKFQHMASGHEILRCNPYYNMDNNRTVYWIMAIYKSIDILLAIVIISRLWDFGQMDVKTNFLNMSLERIVYSILPKGLVYLKDA